jgi:hypothetical protein
MPGAGSPARPARGQHRPPQRVIGEAVENPEHIEEIGEAPGWRP